MNSTTRVVFAVEVFITIVSVPVAYGSPSDDFEVCAIGGDEFREKGRVQVRKRLLYQFHDCDNVFADELNDERDYPGLLDPGAGKTKRAYVWAYARGGFDVSPGVVYEFCLGRGAKYPLEFLKGWSGTLISDGYGVYEQVLKQQSRVGAACFAHARRKFDELVKDNLSPVGTQAIQRIAALYHALPN